MFDMRLFDNEDCAMSVKIPYSVGHLVWAAYCILDDRELIKYRQYPLDKKFIRQYLRGQMAAFGGHYDTLIGENWLNGTDVDEEKLEKAKNWVLSKNWDK